MSSIRKEPDRIRSDVEDLENERHADNPILNVMLFLFALPCPLGAGLYFFSEAGTSPVGFAIAAVETVVVAGVVFYVQRQILVRIPKMPVELKAKNFATFFGLGIVIAVVSCALATAGLGKIPATSAHETAQVEATHTAVKDLTRADTVVAEQAGKLLVLSGILDAWANGEVNATGKVCEQAGAGPCFRAFTDLSGTVRASAEKVVKSHEILAPQLKKMRELLDDVQAMRKQNAPWRDIEDKLVEAVKLIETARPLVLYAVVADASDSLNGRFSARGIAAESVEKIEAVLADPAEKMAKAAADARRIIAMPVPEIRALGGFELMARFPLAFLIPGIAVISCEILILMIAAAGYRVSVALDQARARAMHGSSAQAPARDGAGPAKVRVDEPIPDRPQRANGQPTLS